MTVAHFEFVVNPSLYGSRVLGVVRRTLCFCVRWSKKLRASFPPALSNVLCTLLQTLSASSFMSLNVTFFADVYLRVFQRRQKISKGLNTSLIVSIVRTTTSASKMIFQKYKLNSMYRQLNERWKMLISLSHQKLIWKWIYFWPDPMLSHNHFLWVVMFNLTIFWVCENSISFFPNTEILLIL